MRCCCRCSDRVNEVTNCIWQLTEPACRRSNSRRLAVTATVLAHFCTACRLLTVPQIDPRRLAVTATIALLAHFCTACRLISVPQVDPQLQFGRYSRLEQIPSELDLDSISHQVLATTLYTASASISATHLSVSFAAAAFSFARLAFAV